MVIKNIFWDVDGVLANLNYAYYNFLTKHPKYAPTYGKITWEQLPEVLREYYHVRLRIILF